jgi:hypothetical protein
MDIDSGSCRILCCYFVFIVRCLRVIKLHFSDCWEQKDAFGAALWIKGDRVDGRYGSTAKW